MPDPINIGFTPFGEGDGAGPGSPGVSLTEPIIWNFPGAPAYTGGMSNAPHPPIAPSKPIVPPMPVAPPPPVPPPPQMIPPKIEVLPPDDGDSMNDISASTAPPPHPPGGVYLQPYEPREPSGGYTQPSGAPQSFEMPEALKNPAWIPGFLRTQIGKLMRVEFLNGNQITDRVGRLLTVGANYILLQTLDNSNIIMCDLFSIKFASIVNSDLTPILMI